MKEQKLFEYEELMAMCMMCAANATLLAAMANPTTNPTLLRKDLEDKIIDIINVRWNDPEKKSHQ